jgi:hypothetical protein
MHRFWNSDHACACLRKASEQFEAAELYEQAIHAENLAVAHWLARSDPVRVVSHSRRVTDLWVKLATQAAHGDTRSFGVFYRVGFHGSAFGDLDGREFVYRLPNLAKLGDIAQQLTSMYTAIVGREVTLFKDSSAVDRSALELGAAKLQITAVVPLFVGDPAMDGDAQLAAALQAASPAPSASLPSSAPLTSTTAPDACLPRATAYDRNTNVQLFYFDTPFTADGNSHGTIDTQFKRRTTLRLAHPLSFPAARRRLAVGNRFERVLTPLQCVLEDVHRRTARLEQEAAPALGAPDLKTLTQALSGAVNVQVSWRSSTYCAVLCCSELRSPWPSLLACLC